MQTVKEFLIENDVEDHGDLGEYIAYCCDKVKELSREERRHFDVVECIYEVFGRYVWFYYYHQHDDGYTEPLDIDKAYFVEKKTRVIEEVYFEKVV